MQVPDPEDARRQEDALQTEAPNKASAEQKAKERALREEQARLRLKLEHSTDPDIRAVLQLRLDQIASELPEKPAEAKPANAPKADPIPELEEDLEPDAAPATPAQLAEAERLIRNARVEKMRGNAAAATQFLKQATDIAPGSAPVLEAFADDLLERRQLDAAIKVYKKAFKLAPKNVGLEGKLAEAVLKRDSIGSLDDQMRANLSDSPFLTSADAVARLPVAILLSAIFPGAGHLVLGQNKRGGIILAAWIILSIWLLFMVGDVAKLFAMAGGGSVKPNLTVLLPMFAMAAIYIGALFSLKNMGSVAAKRKVERPRPPVDLPFE